jgi:hypothetical protein
MNGQLSHGVGASHNRTSVAFGLVGGDVRCLRKVLRGRIPLRVLNVRRAPMHTSAVNHLLHLSCGRYPPLLQRSQVMFHITWVTSLLDGLLVHYMVCSKSHFTRTGRTASGSDSHFPLFRNQVCPSSLLFFSAR